MTQVALILFIGAAVFAVLATSQLIKARGVQKTIDNELTAKAEKLEKTRRELNTRAEELARIEDRLEMDSSVPLHATYFVSDSDTIKYTTEARLEKAVRKNLAVQIAASILETFEPKKIGSAYVYELRIKEEGR